MQIREIETENADKMNQLEKILHSRTFHGSEILKAFLKFIVHKTVSDEDGNLKEYIIATEVFGRNTSYDPKIDSVVRVQARRLRSKLQDYYETEGRDDEILIDLPKGQYSVVFSRIERKEEIQNGHKEEIIEAPVWDRTKKTLLASTVLLLVICLSVIYFTTRPEKQLRPAMASGEGQDKTYLKAVWGSLLSSRPILITFSNAFFSGTAEEGMKLVEPLDSPSRLPLAFNGSSFTNVKSLSTEVVQSHYTGTGEVMGVHFLSNLLSQLGASYKVKRSLMLNWDDLKSENVVVLGSPAENYVSRDLPQKQTFVFRVMKTDRGDRYGILNLDPKPGEQKSYFASEEGPSTTQVTEDYSLISLLRGLDENHRLFILAGIKTFGTQAAAEYVTKPEYIRELVSHLNQSTGDTPMLPRYYQLLVKVKVNSGTPVQLSYVTHRVLE
jgi:hypothetical protein